MALFPQDGDTLDDLIKQADTAMYRVKERGRGAYGFYQPQMNAGLLSHMQLEHAMRQAIAAWAHGGALPAPGVYRHGQHRSGERYYAGMTRSSGAVSPSVFIPLAEESGYIITLGAWVLERIGPRGGAVVPTWVLAVRLSVQLVRLEFRQPDFVERLMRLLEAEGLPRLPGWSWKSPRPYLAAGCTGDGPAAWRPGRSGRGVGAGRLWHRLFQPGLSEEAASPPGNSRSTSPSCAGLPDDGA